jgi:hypothetical protein
MRITRGWNITRESWEVLKKDRELLVFPVISLIASLAILGSITFAGVLMPAFGEMLSSILDDKNSHSIGEQALGGLCLFAVYFLEWVIAIYFNTALVGCALKRFEGGNPTLADGFRIANRRLPQILAWALFVSAVGVILSMLEKKMGWLGALVIRLIGLAWASATYFVVPVLAEEGAGPITALQRSVSLLKKTWGEAITGNITVQFVSSGVLFSVIPVILIGVFLGLYLESMIPFIVTGVIAGSVILTILIISSALKQIFLAGLYHFAKSGEVPSGFSQRNMMDALRKDALSE